MIVYYLWGIPRTGGEERQLITTLNGEYITSREAAETVKYVLTRKYSCKGVRIQEVELNKKSKRNRSK